MAGGGTEDWGQTALLPPHFAFSGRPLLGLRTAVGSAVAPPSPHPLTTPPDHPTTPHLRCITTADLLSSLTGRVLSLPCTSLRLRCLSCPSKCSAMAKANKATKKFKAHHLGRALQQRKTSHKKRGKGRGQYILLSLNKASVR